MYPHVYTHTNVQEYFCPFTIGSSLLVLLRYIIHHSAVRELSSRAERAFCLARHSSSRSNARGPLWITPTNVPLSLFFFLSSLLFHSLCPFCWKRLRYRWSSRVSVWNYIFTTICIYCRVSTTRQVVLSRRKKINHGIIYGRNGELMVNNNGRNKGS